MQPLEVTEKVQEFDIPKGAKVLILLDNSGHKTFMSFEGKKKPEDMERVNTGRNVYRIPEKCTSFTIIGEGDYTVGVDFIQSSEEDGGEDRLALLEARVAALEAAQRAPQQEHQVKRNTDKDENEDHPHKGYAARKK